MSSAIHEILAEYSQKAEQQREWASLQQEGYNNLTLKVIQQMGVFFMEMLILSSCQENQQRFLKRQSFEKLKEHVMKCLQKKYQVTSSHINHIFGIFIKQQFQNKIKIYTSLVNQVSESVHELQEDDFQQIQKTYLQPSTIDSDTYRQILDKEQYSKILKEDYSLRQDRSQQCYNNGQYCSENQVQREDHYEQVIEYLKKISNPQGEITYLTQHMNWPLAVYDKFERGKISEYTCKIQWTYKNKKGVINTRVTALNKKQGKFISALKTLREIYTKNKVIWEQFRKIRQTKKLDIAMGNQNDEILQKMQEQDNQKGHKKSSNEQEIRLKKLQEDIRAYLPQTKSYKAEISHLSQQNSKQFQQPIHLKEQHNAMWTVTSSIKIQRSGRIKIYKHESHNLNSKAAQQKNTCQILFAIYKDHPDIWLKFRAFKKSKNHQF